MKKKILYSMLILFSILIAFTFWMSPSLMGLIPGGKETPDKGITKIYFDTEKELNIVIPYSDISKNKELKIIKEVFRLDTLLLNTNDEYEKIKNIQSWVHSRWEHDGDNVPEKNNAQYILKEAEKGQRFRCVEYSTVTTACLQSLGYIVRGLWLKTKDVDVVNSGAGHVVNEIYLDDLKKWFFIDPQFDITVLKNGIPLNAIEFQSAIANNELIEIINPNKEISDAEYIEWISPYLFYFTTSLNKGKISNWDRVIGTKKQLTLVPKGHKPPIYFQRLFRIRTNYKTNSISDFYPIVE
ncbi:transglutaminase-like domain-containing protein [Psychroserpens sp.]